MQKTSGRPKTPEVSSAIAVARVPVVRSGRRDDDTAAREYSPPLIIVADVGGTTVTNMANDQLPGVFGHLQPVLEHYGYLAVGGFILLEDFGVPVPGETILIAAAVFAGSGHLNIALVILVGVLGAVIGDNIGFTIGHFGGRPLVERYGRYIFLTPERLDHAEGFINRHGGKVVTVARFIEGLRQVNGILAGTVGMHWLKFLAFNTLGAVLWVGTWAGIGYFAGENITEIYEGFDRYKWYVIAAGVIIAALLITRRVRVRRRRASA
jgi:membrane protein DedA with SNARE-associated domain